MNIEIITALEFFELIPPLQNIDVINKKYKRLSMKYHPDRKGGTNEKFKLLGKYKEILVKNFDKLELGSFYEFKKVKEDFYNSKTGGNSKEKTTKTTYTKPKNSFKGDFFEYGKFSIFKFLYKIYFEKLKIKILSISLLLLIISLYLKIDTSSLLILLIAPVGLFFKSLSDEEEIYYYKDIFIFFGIGKLLMFLITGIGLYGEGKEESIYSFLIYVVILPIIWFFFFRYGVNILKNIFQKIINFLSKIIDFISYIFLKITNFFGFIIEKIMIFCLYAFAFIIPTMFFTKIENLIEPLEKGRESIFYTFKILIIYGVFLLIYTYIYKKYLKVNDEKWNTFDKILYFTGLCISLFSIISLVSFLTKYFG